jgi:hypothetical protein
MLTPAQAEAAGLLQAVPAGYCVSCKERKAVEGRLMCHECRLAADISEQQTLFEEGES